MDQVREAAHHLNLKLETIAVPNRDADAISLITGSRVGGLLVALDPVVAGQGKRIVEVAIQKRWSTMFAGVVARTFVQAGGLMYYSASTAEAWKRVTGQVDKILKGVRPADAPMEQPTQFDVVINLKTAKALGLVIP